MRGKWGSYMNNTHNNRARVFAIKLPETCAQAFRNWNLSLFFPRPSCVHCAVLSSPHHMGWATSPSLRTRSTLGTATGVCGFLRQQGVCAGYRPEIEIPIPQILRRVRETRTRKVPGYCFRHEEMLFLPQNKED